MNQPKFDPQKHHRRSIRLPGYDYSQAGAYYVTIVTYQRDCLFGKIENEEMILSDLGKIADECWRAIPEHFPFLELGAYVIMPNHVHGIIVSPDTGRGAAWLRPYDQPDVNDNPHKINVKSGSLGAIVRSYKSAVSYRINKEYDATGIWQRNYYEHVIRDETDLQNKTDYIEANPLLWDEDENNPQYVQNN
jgi:putative transposase